MMAPCAYRPVEMSVTATPTLLGGPVGSPVLFSEGGERVREEEEGRGGE